MLKSFVLAGAFVLAAVPAMADVCAWMPKAASEQAVKLLPKGTLMLDYCLTCGDKMATKITVVTSSSQKDPDAKPPEDFSVKVNDIEYDIGHVFVLGGRDKKQWVNLGFTVKCSDDPDNFETKILDNKFVPVLPPTAQ